MVSRAQFRARMTPLRFFVNGGLGQRAQSADGAAIGADGRAGDLRSRWLIHERHELVRETRHGEANAYASHIGAAADSGHPSAFGNVAVHHRAPASELHDALRRAVYFGEI